MAMITLHNASLPEVTILSNTFIDNYMPEANGEFVKVYKNTMGKREVFLFDRRKMGML